MQRLNLLTFATKTKNRHDYYNSRPKPGLRIHIYILSVNCFDITNCLKEDLFKEKRGRLNANYLLKCQRGLMFLYTIIIII